MRRIILACALFACEPAESDPPPDPDHSGVYCTAVRPPERCAETGPDAVVVDLANQARAMMSLDGLTCDAAMSRAALGHSDDMCARGFFDHVSPEGALPWDRMRDEGVKFCTAAENIAQGYLEPAEVHEGWMNSPGHRENLMNSDYGRIGVGHAPCKGKYYWTQVFAD